MKRFDRMLAMTVPLYLILAAVLWFLFYSVTPNLRVRVAAQANHTDGLRPFFGSGETGQDVAYKVEINQVMQGLEMEGTFSKPDLRGREYIREMAFLPAGAEAEKIQEFYQNRNGMHMTVRPLIIQGSLKGYVRFDYMTGAENRKMLYGMEGILFFWWFLFFMMLWYIRQKIVRPFHRLCEMPYELAKGNLQWEPEESRERFFGKFVWGISMLRDELVTSRNRALKLEKEKKMLLLSVSHDIKIPLSAIRLYAKALRDGIYATDAEKDYGAAQIEKHVQEIEAFVSEIVSTAREDILAIEVADSEFYLENYVEKIRECYGPKCRLAMTDFRIGKYENKLLKGDMDRAFEVMENLMENAFKYGDGREICIDFHEEEYCQVISIFNSGAAVRADEMPHLFDSFYRGSNAGSREGNGLGLYIGRYLMRKMGGDLFAERQEGGVRFCLVFRE